MPKARQLEMFKKPALEYGGGLERGRRKTYRPFDSKKPVHVVMRAGRARGEWSLLRPANRKTVDHIVRTYAKRFRVRVMEFQNVGNHLHLLVQASRRRDFRSFMRTIPAQIATKVTGAKKGNALRGKRHDGGSDRVGGVGADFKSDGTGGADADSEKNGSKRKFWDGLAYSRIVHWGRDLLGLRHYLTKNAFEGEGVELMTVVGVVRRFFIRNGKLVV
ncbi:MAG: transposase [Deltaproteobacteria bacterium]|nr:transposase [Deltaproteobacteria bacterium]